MPMRASPRCLGCLLALFFAVSAAASELSPLRQRIVDLAVSQVGVVRDAQFAVWVLRQAGVQAKWAPIKGGWGPVGIGAPRQDLRNASPGDVVVLKRTVQHAILAGIDAGVATIFAAGGAAGVQQRRKGFSELWYYYRTPTEAAAAEPPPAPSEQSAPSVPADL